MIPAASSTTVPLDISKTSLNVATTPIARIPRPQKAGHTGVLKVTSFGQTGVDSGSVPGSGNLITLH